MRAGAVTGRNRGEWCGGAHPPAANGVARPARPRSRSTTPGGAQAVRGDAGDGDDPAAGDPDPTEPRGGVARHSELDVRADHPRSGGAHGVFLLRQHMLPMADELTEAARIDGAWEWRIFWQVVPALARPALAVLAIFSVIWRWNDFLWPLIIAQDESTYALPLAIAQFSSELVVSLNLVLAMSLLSALPVIVVFLSLSGRIVSGIAQTGMK